MNQQQYRLMEIIRKIHIFRNLELEEIQRLLRLSKTKIFSPGDVIYTVGEPGDEMLTLLQGRLVVTTASGDILGEIKPGTVVGEMGLLTGQPRSASISAVEKSLTMVIGKKEMDALFGANQKMHVKIMRNVVDVLSERLVAANEQNDRLSRKVQDLEAKVFGGEDHEEEEIEEEEEI